MRGYIEMVVNPGHRVDLVDHRAILGEEEVDPGQSLAVQRVEGSDGQVLQQFRIGIG